MSLKQQITDDMKAAMRSGNVKERDTIRLLQAAIKQREVDERIVLDDAAVIAVIEKMLKQRRDSIAQYEAAQRMDLAEKEKDEILILSGYMPQALSDSEIEALIGEAVFASSAKSMQDMGKVMALLKPKLAGRADMGRVSALIKAKLSNG
ncbi:GatB/YqeY domain-containing protein [Nitrosomonas sp. JL21]|uniref:GatB/YqeY domain-containing protein n=1 Tax=Nitrosomonas sp. JL21 TaxID=153949 RepID=UPI00136C37AC|nr:GatB/YqeY domain-containing protein [Nitrosomonas sp. JL21]MBL8497464.1 GatB/YqeY domain-containing protein [Nitrosomonas sp.]MCC7091547.1 GatB/YqeY domain-containing protein [Nitrosomonas sp.]MXS78655.1 GatB/YqeY domain-containing protein [Nitrosomonas sp. JL21]